MTFPIAIAIGLAWSGVVMWVHRAHGVYTVLKAQVGFEYGRDQWFSPAVRRRMALRSALWWVPEGIYHFRERAWRRRIEQLKEAREPSRVQANRPSRSGEFSAPAASCPTSTGSGEFEV